MMVTRHISSGNVNCCETKRKPSSCTKRKQALNDTVSSTRGDYSCAYRRVTRATHTYAATMEAARTRTFWNPPWRTPTYLKKWVAAHGERCKTFRRTPCSVRWTCSMQATEDPVLRRRLSKHMGRGGRSRGRRQHGTHVCMQAGCARAVRQTAVAFSPTLLRE